MKNLLIAGITATALLVPAAPAFASGNPDSGTGVTFTVLPAEMTITGADRPDAVITVVRYGNTIITSAA